MPYFYPKKMRPKSANDALRSNNNPPSSETPLDPSKTLEEEFERHRRKHYETSPTSRQHLPSPYRHHDEREHPAVTSLRPSGTRTKKERAVRIRRDLFSDWARFLKGVGIAEAMPDDPDESEASSSSAIDHRVADLELAKIADDAEVDEVVVDTTWGRTKVSSDITASEGESGTLEKAGLGVDTTYGGTSASSERNLNDSQGIWALLFPFRVVKGRLWPIVTEFFSCRFHDPKVEAAYRKEIWFQAKVCRQPSSRLSS